MVIILRIFNQQEVKMKPEKIKQEEQLFIDSLRAKNNKNYELRNETVLEGDVRIYSIRPRHSSYYYQTKTEKKSICLHFTAGYIKSDLGALTKEDNHVSVSYVVDRSGRIYELFDDSYWSYHLGASALGGNTVMSKQSIGIEISNYGFLKPTGGNLIDAYGNIYCGLDESCYYEKMTYRNKDYFATMTDEQVSATATLLKYLSKKHEIPLRFKCDDGLFASDKEASNYNGVFLHSNVRKDKFDWPMGSSIRAVIEKCL